MSSNLDAIVEGIAAQIRTVTALKHVYTYEPEQPGATPMVYLDAESWDYPETTYGEMTIGWNPEGYLVLAPLASPADVVAALARQIIPQIIEAVGHDLDAHGALTDGQVLLVRAEHGRLTIGKTQYYARRLHFRAIERFAYDYAL